MLLNLSFYRMRSISLLTLLLSLNSACQNGGGCFKHPLDCIVDTSCVYVFSWVEFGTTYNISLWTSLNYFDIANRDNIWVAFGLSDEGTMADSQITVCAIIQNDSSVIQVNGFSHGVSPIAVPTTTLTSNVYTTVEDGSVSCRFLLYKSLLSTTPKKMFFGAGPIQDGDLQYHRRTPISSEDVVDLAEFNEFGGVTRTTDYKILFHASAMLTGYGIFLVIGMYTSRYLKPIFETAWYRIHTGMMMGVVGMAAVGLTMILIYEEGKIETGTHEILGFIIIVITVLQIVLGLCRPHQKHPKRHLFVIVHVIVACALLFLVFIEIFLGLAKTKLNIPTHIIVLQIFYVLWVIVGCIVGNELLKRFSDDNTYVERLKVFTVVNIGIILAYGVAMIMLLNIIA